MLRNMVVEESPSDYSEIPRLTGNLPRKFAQIWPVVVDNYMQYQAAGDLMLGKRKVQALSGVVSK